MATFLRKNGLEVDVLVVDERELEPIVTVKVIGTGEEKKVPIGQLSSDRGDLAVYQAADEIITEDDTP